MLAADTAESCDYVLELVPNLTRVFAKFPIPAITADVDPRNAASQRLLTSLGFHETHRMARTWLVGAEWCDSIYLALARPRASSAGAAAG